MAETSTDDAVVLERTFAAPPATVWAMWTEPDHFVSWYGPDGVTVAVAAMDVRHGGEGRVSMTMVTPDGDRVMWFAGEHREDEPPSRLVYTVAMVDEDGHATSPSTLVEVVLDEREGGTHLVLTHRGVPADSPGATGWAMALDKLTAALEGA